MARFFFGVSRTSARNSSDRIEMSGLWSPAAFMMSTISVETTARLTICWIASSRSAGERLPSPGALFDERSLDRLKEPDLVADRARLSLAPASANACESR